MGGVPRLSGPPPPRGQETSRRAWPAGGDWEVGVQGSTAQLSKPGTDVLRVGRAHVESENMLTLGEARESSWQALEILGGKVFPRMKKKRKRTKTLSIQKLPRLRQFIELYRNYKNSLFSDLLLLSLRAKHKKASDPIKLQATISTRSRTPSKTAFAPVSSSKICAESILKHAYIQLHFIFPTVFTA